MFDIFEEQYYDMLAIMIRSKFDELFQSIKSSMEGK